MLLAVDSTTAIWATKGSLLFVYRGWHTTQLQYIGIMISHEFRIPINQPVISLNFTGVCSFFPRSINLGCSQMASLEFLPFHGWNLETVGENWGVILVSNDDCFFLIHWFWEETLGAERYHIYRISALLMAVYTIWEYIFLGVYIIVPLVQGAWEFSVIPTTFFPQPKHGWLLATAS